jgi:hypothetical protein
LKTEAESQRDKDAQTDKEIFDEAKDFLALCVDAESGNRARAIEALRFRDGDQWPQALFSQRQLDGRLSLTINHTNTFVSRVENAMKQQRPRIKVHPVGDADVEKARIINGVTRHIENRSNASIAYDAGGSSALTIGWGYWRLIPEYIRPDSFDQELRITPIPNAFTVYRDPGSIMPDGSDSMRYLVTEKIKRRKYRQLYPGAKNAQWLSGGPGDDDVDWETSDEIRLAEYFRIIEKPERLFKMVGGSTRFESDFAPGVLATALKRPQDHGFAMEGAKAFERQSAKRQVQWFRINGREIVDRRDLPGEHIPIVAVEGNTLDINGKRSRKGMVSDMMEPGRMVNYWETMKTERLALTPKAEWTAYESVIEGHSEWHDANQKSYSVLVGKAVQGPNGETLPLPTKTQPAGVEAGFSEAMQSAYSALMAIAGMPNEPGQDKRGEVVSGVALRERRDLADVTHFQYYDNVTVSIAFTGKLILEWIPHIYNTQRMQRIIGEDGVPEMVQINAPNPDQEAEDKILNDLTVGEYDIVMDTGPGYETKRQEAMAAMTDLMKTPMAEVVVKTSPDVVLRNMDFEGAEEMANRALPLSPEGMDKAIKELPKNAQAIVTALQQQLKNTTDALQHAQLELKYKTSTELGWMHVEREKSHLQAETKVHDTQIKADTSIKTAEISAGAQLLNAHVEAEHEKAAAREMLKHAAQAEGSA